MRLSRSPDAKANKVISGPAKRSDCAVFSGALPLIFPDRGYPKSEKAAEPEATLRPLASVPGVRNPRLISKICDCQAARCGLLRRLGFRITGRRGWSARSA